jgi:hypothetical protein
MRINVAIPEPDVEAPVLDAALESVTRLDEKLLRDGKVPTFSQALRSHGIRWKPEPPGQEHFDHAGLVMQRGNGDCDDLASWHSASLRHTGEDPGAQAVVTRSGPKTWHAVVQRSDGRIDDPSVAAGMGRPHGVNGAWLPLMSQPPSSVSGAYIVRPSIALRPVRGGFQARADLPWHWREHLQDEPQPTDYAMTALHTAPVASTALVGACHGACVLGVEAGFSHPEHIDRLCAIADACEGVPFEQLAETYGPEHAEAAREVVGSFFGSLGRSLGHFAHAALPFASKLVQFVPGVGPIASTALDVASHLIPAGHPAAALQHLPGMIPGLLPPDLHPGAAAIDHGVHFHCVPFT